MTDERSYRVQQTPRPRSRRGLVLVPLLAFLLGLAAMAWLLTRWDRAAEYLGIVRLVEVQPEPSPPPLVQLAPPSPVPPAAAPPADPALEPRVVELEQRLDQIESLSQAAIGNADRTEGLLVALAARRALDRGVPLGYIEGLLRRRFGQSEPQAVGTIIAAARQPVTLDELQEGLLDVAPTLGSGNSTQGWWSAVRTELNALVTVRKAGTSSTLPQERVARATRRLEAGQVDVALAEVLRLPARERAAGWIGEARRYVSARRALDTIETSALLGSQAQAAGR